MPAFAGMTVSGVGYGSITYCPGASPIGGNRALPGALAGRFAPERA